MRATRQAQKPVCSQRRLQVLHSVAFRLNLALRHSCKMWQSACPERSLSSTGRDAGGGRRLCPALQPPSRAPWHCWHSLCPQGVLPRLCHTTIAGLPRLCCLSSSTCHLESARDARRPYQHAHRTLSSPLLREAQGNNIPEASKAAEKQHTMADQFMHACIHADAQGSFAQVAGASAAAGDDLATVLRKARATAQSMGSMGVATSVCTAPGNSPADPPRYTPHPSMLTSCTPL